jgi:hypothetical protein
MRPRSNVIVMLCSIECCFSHPLATCDSKRNRAFRADIEAWAHVAPRLWIWDYTTNFHNYLLPFPNLRSLGPNIQFFGAHHVTGIFEEDAPDTRQSQFAALHGYVMAKGLWNPNYDANLAVREFTKDYYGPAAVPIRKYLDLIHDYVKRKDIHVGVYFNANSPHLSEELLIAADRLWQEAERLAAGDRDVLHRVRITRLSVDYAILERARLHVLNKLKKTPNDEKLMALAAARFQPFFDVLKTSRITRFREGGAPLDKEAYRRQLAQDLRLPTPDGPVTK